MKLELRSLAPELSVIAQWLCANLKFAHGFLKEPLPSAIYRMWRFLPKGETSHKLLDCSNPFGIWNFWFRGCVKARPLDFCKCSPLRASIYGCEP